MGLLSRLLGPWFGRRLGVLDEDRDEADRQALKRPPLTPTIQPIARPRDTPTSKPLHGAGSTRGTPSYRTPQGTPSTQRIHNPTRPGR